MSLLLGVDPGWKNLGYAILADNGSCCFELVASGVENPSKADSEFPSLFASKAWSIIGSENDFAHKSVERYVPYNNTFTAETENITMIIGGLREVFRPVNLYRAIDWKTQLVKLLAKHTGFDNPSTSLDKKFSIAAAKHILNGKGDFNSDHEADAICLAAFPAILSRYSR